MPSPVAVLAVGATAATPIDARIKPEYPHLPRVTPPQALHALDGGGLARPVRAEDAEDLSLIDVK
jgi:hypothetical protein